jgi:hypothetical protein
VDQVSGRDLSLMRVTRVGMTSGKSCEHVDAYHGLGLAMRQPAAGSPGVVTVFVAQRRRVNRDPTFGSSGR